MNFEKYVRLTTGFQNAKYAIGFNGLQVCPSVLLNLVAVPTTGKFVRNPTKSGVQVTLTKIRIPVPGIRNRWRGIRNQSLSWITLQ